MYFGVTRTVALNVLKSGIHILSYIGDINRPMADVITLATPFILACYGQTKCSSLTKDSQKMWVSKVSQSVASAPKLESLPPTTEAFSQNVAHAQVQVAVWKKAMDPYPAGMDPKDFGWSLRESKQMTPTPIPDKVLLALDALLRLVKCYCGAETRTNKCGCQHATLSCSVFCSCQKDQDYFSDKTREAL